MDQFDQLSSQSVDDLILDLTTTAKGAIDYIGAHAEDEATKFIARKVSEDFLPLIENLLVRPLAEQLKAAYRAHVESLRRLRRTQMLFTAAASEIESEAPIEPEPKKLPDLKAWDAGKWLV